MDDDFLLLEGTAVFLLFTLLACVDTVLEILLLTILTDLRGLFTVELRVRGIVSDENHLMVA